jgi:hypothetical protein
MIKEKMKQLTRAMNDKKNTNCSLIIGGDISYPDYKANSKILFNNLLTFIQKSLKIDPSYFWGQDNINDSKGLDAYYTSSDDTWRILKYKGKTAKSISSLEELTDGFNEIHLSKNDKLFIGEEKKEITKKQLDKYLDFKESLKEAV